MVRTQKVLSTIIIHIQLLSFLSGTSTGQSPASAALGLCTLRATHILQLPCHSHYEQPQLKLGLSFPKIVRNVKWVNGHVSTWKWIIVCFPSCSLWSRTDLWVISDISFFSHIFFFPSLFDSLPSSDFQLLFFSYLISYNYFAKLCQAWEKTRARMTL